MIKYLWRKYKYRHKHVWTHFMDELNLHEHSKCVSCGLYAPVYDPYIDGPAR